MRLKDHVAVVTGGGSGIGRASCLVFAAEGAKVVVADLRHENAAQVAKEVEAEGREALAVAVDVSDSTQVAALFQKAVARFGTVDILVNGAGIGDPPGKAHEMITRRAREVQEKGRAFSSLEVTRNMTDEEWQRMLNVHLSGTFFCTREALKIMEPKRYGKIINISSGAGQVGLPGWPHYGAAKAGIIGFTKSVAVEVIPCGIYVNAIAPGYIDTPMTQAQTEVVRLGWLAASPIGRPGQAEEIAHAALYLASDESSFVVGQVLAVNGGMVL